MRNDANKSQMYDAIVVGAGPAGSTVANLLASASLKVALIEEHAEVGVPRHCSGLVSPRTLDIAGIDKRTVEVGRHYGARIWSPTGHTLQLNSTRLQAIAIDRVKFDKLLAECAIASGAHLMLNTRAKSFLRTSEDVQVEVQEGQTSRKLHGKLLIGADGANSRVASWIIENTRNEVIPSLQANIEFLYQPLESVEVFIGSTVAPGWFGWLIPQPRNEALLGLGTTSKSVKDYFDDFCELVQGHFGKFSIRRLNGAPLPLGPADKFVADRVMLVGAAAGQTKPSTGGGIYLSIRAANLAAETALHALQKGNFSQGFLSEYERAWQQVEGEELKFQSWLRRGFTMLSDHQFDLLLRLLNKPWAQKAISEFGDIDYSSVLFGSLIPALSMEHGEIEHNITPLIKSYVNPAIKH